MKERLTLTALKSIPGCAAPTVVASQFLAPRLVHPKVSQTSEHSPTVFSASAHDGDATVHDVNAAGANVGGGRSLWGLVGPINASQIQSALRSLFVWPRCCTAPARSLQVDASLSRVLYISTFSAKSFSLNCRYDRYDMIQ
jgi:hypothetical protein